jgi:hypothetical protein
MSRGLRGSQACAAVFGITPRSTQPSPSRDTARAMSQENVEIVVGQFEGVNASAPTLWQPGRRC